jgi:hypothetical protein
MLHWNSFVRRWRFIQREKRKLTKRVNQAWKLVAGVKQTRTETIFLEHK